MQSDIIVTAANITDAIEALVTKGGSNAREAKLVATNLVEANLKGHDSHGIGMIPRYIDSLKEGGLAVNQSPKIELDTGPLLRLDGQSGYGQVIGHDSMVLAIERAQKHGICAAALSNSHHIGRIGHWAEQVVEAGLISLHFVNVVSRPIVATWGGGDGRFGTNPICIGLPRKNKSPIILDFATSRIAQGKVRVAHNKGKKIEPGTLIDDKGRPTTEPKYCVEPPHGAILPFGEHKGSGLALMAELLGGALTGGSTGRHPYKGQKKVINNMLTIVLDPKKLGTTDHFQNEVKEFVAWLKKSPPAEGIDKVRIAGEPEREWKSQRLKDGIPIDPTTWSEVISAAEKVGLSKKDFECIAAG